MEKIFKAQRLDTGEWVEFTLEQCMGLSVDDRGYRVNLSIPFNRDTVDPVIIEVKRDTISQYTGINDSEGNKIFEGDELDFDPVEWGGPHKFFIEWNDRDACFVGSGDPFDWPQWCTLTGHNIHDRG